MNAPPLTGPYKARCRENRARCHDFYKRYDALLANWFLLTSRIQDDLQALRRDLRDELARWRPSQPDPDWNVYADRLNSLCLKSGVPPTSTQAAG
jgi:hypothetical protein